MDHFLPTIWMGAFQNKAEYDRQTSKLKAVFSVYDWLDDRVLHSRHGFFYPAFCSACGRVTSMWVDWTYSAAGYATSVNPAWTETAKCESCGLNSRMRAVVEFLITQCDMKAIHQAYIPERITSSFRILKGFVPGLIGSEYLGAEFTGGKIVNQWKKGRRFRHEDLTALSFANELFDLVITQDVFEHIPGYLAAFTEILRVLKPGGQLIFTIPFFIDLETTRIRASLGDEGIIHHLPAEIHGNPVSAEGSLCYQNFGWVILSDLRRLGFKQAQANMYWGPWQGHLGYPFFVFSALKT